MRQALGEVLFWGSAIVVGLAGGRAWCWYEDRRNRS